MQSAVAPDLLGCGCDVFKGESLQKLLPPLTAVWGGNLGQTSGKHRSPAGFEAEIPKGESNLKCAWV